MKETITIALSKGRLFDEALALLKKAGIQIAESNLNSRKLVVPDTQKRFQFFMVKPIDVPTYVEYGVADVGIAGRDVLAESGADIHQPLDLRIGYCKMVVAAPKAAALRVLLGDDHVQDLRPGDEDLAGHRLDVALLGDRALHLDRHADRVGIQDLALLVDDRRRRHLFHRLADEAHAHDCRLLAQS